MATNDADEKRIILRGNTKLLRPIITQLLAINQLLESKDIGSYYGIPVTTFQDDYKFHPQIKLMFYQVRSETKNNNPRVYAEITYRIMGETSETFTKANATVRAQAIKRLFIDPAIFVWRKGKEIVSYRDEKNGYDFRLRVRNKEEGKRIITQVMTIENKIPDWKFLIHAESDATFPEIPESKMIFGEQRRMPRRRPLEDIKFRYAELHLFGLTNAVTLVDTTGRRGTPLVRAF